MAWYVWAWLFFFIIAFPILYGALFAYWQGEFPSIANDFRNSDMFDSFFFAFLLLLLGPIGFLAAFFGTERFKHGFKFW